MAAQDFFANSVTITPVFTPSASLLDASVKLETIQSSPILPNSGDFDDFSSWVKCDFCDYRCPKKDRLSRHVRNVHYKEKPFGCNLCDASFGRKDKMKRHMATVHSQERPFKCDFCNHSSGRKDKIREHVQSVHLKTRPPRPKKKYPKKPKAQITSSITNSSSSAVSTEIVNLPQHPLPRHELHTGFHHPIASSNASAGLVTLTPVNFALANSSHFNSMVPLDIQPFQHQPSLVNVTNPQSIYKLVA